LSNGDVVLVPWAAPPWRVAKLLGPPTSIAALDDTHVVVRIARSMLAWLTLAPGSEAPSASATTANALDGRPITDVGGTTRVLSSAWELLRFDRSARSLGVVPLEVGPSELGSAESSALVDASGRVAFARGGRVGVVSATTAVTLGRPCTNPVGIASSGPARLLVACRDGALVWLGEAPTATPSEAERSTH
jgi:hypothetical protein